MKKQWISMTISFLGAVIALLPFLLWGGDYSVSGTAIAAPLEPVPLAEEPDDLSVAVASMDTKSAASDAPDGWVVECVDCRDFSFMTDRSLRLDTHEYPHIAYGEKRLFYAYYDGSDWQLETVEDAQPNNVGMYASLDLDGSGYPHISYYDATNWDLKYAYKDGAGWHIQTLDSGGDVGRYTSLALDDSGYPHISYYDASEGNLKYTYRDGDGWHIQTLDNAEDVGQDTSLALDGSGYPHISYYDNTLGDLKYTYRDGDGWHTEVAASGGDVGQYTSLALDSDGYPHISALKYVPFSARDLVYAYQDGTGWYTRTVDSDGAVGLYTSLDLDSDGHAHISYYDSTDDDLKYAYQDAGGWHITIPAGYLKDVGRYTSLVVDSDGYAHISYYYNVNYASGTDYVHGLRYIEQYDGGWYSNDVDGEYAGMYTSLALDSGGYPHISHYDRGDQDLRYAYQDVEGWHVQVLDSEGAVGYYSSLALDGSDYPHIAYWHNSISVGGLKYAYQDDSGWHTEIVQTPELGMMTDISLALDDGGYPHISYFDSGQDYPDRFPGLHYAYQDSDGWHLLRLDYGTEIGGSSLALDAAGYPHISYIERSDGLKYIYQNSEGWYVNTLASGVDYHDQTSLALDTDGYPHIVYFDINDNDVKYQYQDAGDWYIYIVDPEAGFEVKYLSLSLDKSNYPHISYYSNGSLRYAYQDNSGWYSQTVESGAGEYNSLTLDAAGYPHISYGINSNGGELKYAHLVPPPRAAFTAAPTYGFAPLPVAFTDTSTGTLEGWLWEFGDGLTSTLESPTHTYTTIGTHAITLTVSGPGGTDTLTRTDYITVYEAVRADFTASPVQGVVPLVVTFTDTSSGPVTVWQWDFGDGAMSTLQHPTHTYTTTGVYTVALTAQVAGASAMLPGGTDTLKRRHYITVSEAPPQVDFVGNPRSGDAPLTVHFTSTVTGTVTDYQWNFGHGGVADTPNPTHTYPHAGSFGVTLVVTGPGGTADISKPGYIAVNAAPGAPTATFTADVTSGTVPLTVTFTAVTSGTVEHWLWSFGDGGTAFTGPVVSHTYVTSDTFDVSLTVSNTHGSFIVSTPAYITVRTKDDDSHFIYLPLILRNAP